ncbi:MAG: Peptidyl-prolyl isomerase cwc27 [Icmadophila ericetorum]|nr:Peptidyl-prolyl isomerase cwc27 [Icmadophila ericetorum]
MSTVYNLEPQPTAKVLLNTTSGDILLELFAKQTPLTSRNFLQLCLDGYYDGTIFHRVVPGFIIQGGDPTGTGEGGESSYDGEAFVDESHSRLKFNRRGLLGMANSGKKDDNGSQFFLTLGKAEELNGKNTMFGRIVGDTIYNLMKIGEADLVGENEPERPIYPTKIVNTEILVNPFDDMVARTATRATKAEEAREEKKKPRKKAAKTLLSFQGDDGTDTEEATVMKKAKFNPNLVTDTHTPQKVASKSLKKTGPLKPERSISTRKSWSASPPPQESSKPAAKPSLSQKATKEFQDRSSSEEPEQVERVSSLLERTNAQIADLKNSMRRNVPAAPTRDTSKLSELEQMIPATATRGRKRKHGDNSRDAEALSILAAFRKKLETAPPEITRPETKMQDAEDNEALLDGSGKNYEPADDEESQLCDLHFIANCESCKSWDLHQTDELEGEDDDKGWMSHALSFEKDRLGKDLKWKRKNEEELLVIDPREKAKTIKEEQRAKKAAVKSGVTGRAWDREMQKVE